MPKPRNTEAEMPATEREPAPATEATQVPPPPPPPPPRPQVERQGDKGVPYSRKFPEVRGGTCEYCGVLDPKVAAEFQYKLCPHYRGMDLRCSYCPDYVNPIDVVGHETLSIHEHPYQPGVLIVICGKYECSKKHQERFQIANT